MPRPALRLLFAVSALALLGVRLSDAHAGTVPPAHARRQSPPSLLAHSRHRFYYDSNALEAYIGAKGEGIAHSASLEDLVSPHEVLLSAAFADGAFHSAYRLDLRTGKVHPDQWLTHQIRDQGYLKPRGWKLSPDGKWILWKNGWNIHNYSIAATPLKPSRQHPHSLWWNLHSDVPVQEAQIAWFPDARHWVELWSPERDLPTEAHVYSLGPHGRDRTVSIASAHPGPDFAGIADDATIVTTKSIDADEFSTSNFVAVITFRLDAPRQTRRRVVVHAPAGGLVQGCNLSPDGRTIAWAMTSRNDTLIVGTTDATGAHWHEIGEQTRPGTGALGGGYLAGWLPDSKSFLVCLCTTNPKRGRDDLRQVSVR